MGVQVVPLGPPADEGQQQQAGKRRSLEKNTSIVSSDVNTVLSSLDAYAHGKRDQTLAHARVAGPDDRELLHGTCKSNIHSIKVLGEGAFGIVDLVLVELPGAQQPLLCVRKKLLKQTAHNNNDPQLEIEFMEAFTASPFVVHLWSQVVGLYDYTLLIEYCPYGALDKLLVVVSDVRTRAATSCLTGLRDKLLGSERYQGFTEQEARFYIACCVLGLEAMHAQGVLHRDLKPSNLLLSEQGYAKLGDLGLCKQLGSESMAHSLAGTPGYMAPEVLNCKGARGAGYSFPADIWSLGIMTWELVNGLPPRWAPLSWYYTTTLHFPDSFSPALRSLLTGLLEKAPTARPKLSDIKRHAWFQGLDWQALAEQRLPAPAYPELQMVHIHSQLGAVHGKR